MPFAAPSQTISYLSSHDDWTLYDKLAATLLRRRQYASVPDVVLRANRLAAAILSMCQGRLFMLSGEEFARTKHGVRNSYRSPLRINRIDWNRAYKNRELVDYYRGLIALRKTLPGLCDKGMDAHRRVLRAVDTAPGAGYVLLDNRGGESAYDQLLMAVNTAQQAHELTLPQGEWRVLADGESAFIWQTERTVQDAARLAPVSALLLGRISAGS